MANQSINLEKLMSSILEIESSSDVSLWNYQGVELWPLIKHVTFFDFKEDKKSFSKFQSLRKIVDLFSKKIKNKIQQYKNLNDNIPLSDLPKSDILFCGANSHYVFWNNYNMNRYFDPIMDTISKSSIYLNYSINDLSNIYKEERCFNIYRLLKSTKSFWRSDSLLNIDLKDVIKSSKNLSQILIELATLVDSSDSVIIAKVEQKLKSILKWKSNWLILLEQIQPKVGVVLCYYDPAMYGLILALKELKIPSVDMQHGGQGIGHPAYSYSPKIKSSFKLVPDFFWVWDRSAEQNIMQWGSQLNHKAIIGGNPWIRMFTEMKGKKSLFPEQKYILCTLPADKSYYRIMPEPLLKAIEASGNEYLFGFRFHPKTTISGRKNIENMVIKKNLTKKIDFIAANQQPLPYLFSSSWAHISVGSIGSISEASIIGLHRNIILDGIGLSYYSKLVEDKKAHYFDIDSGDDLISFISNIEDKNESEKINCDNTYEDVLSNIIADNHFKN